MPDLNRIKGSIPPVVTPIRDGDVDYDAYAGLVEFQVARGSHGVLVNGTTSEPSTLTTDERNRLVDHRPARMQLAASPAERPGQYPLCLVVGLSF